MKSMLREVFAVVGEPCTPSAGSLFLLFVLILFADIGVWSLLDRLPPGLREPAAYMLIPAWLAILLYGPGVIWPRREK